MPHWARYWGTQVTCYALGLCFALWLQDALRPPFSLFAPTKAAPVRISVRSAPPPAPAAATPAKVLPIAVEHATPAPTPKPKPRPKPVPSPAEPTLSAEALPTLSQPTIAPPTQTWAPVLPPVPAGPMPPAPPESATYLEEPGGAVLVLGVTINDQGLVIDTQILVSSANPLNDLTIALASRGQFWKNLDPPLTPGEERHLELRIPYADEKPLFTLP